MRMLLVSLVAGAAVGVAGSSAEACGIPDFKVYMDLIADAVAPNRVPVSEPVVIVGGGVSLDGTSGSVAAGWSWGERDRGGMFPGSVTSRVLAGVRSDGQHTAVSLTYGWYENQVLSAGFDFGTEATASGVGPTTRLTLGTHGIAVRLTGGLDFTSQAIEPVAAAELVIDVGDLGSRI
jgi:hypothetical protein